MLKHIVMWRFKEEADGSSKKDNVLKAKEMLENLVGKIDTLTSLEVGINVNPTPAAFDLVLTSVHPDQEGLDAYQVHPAHQEVVKFIVPVVSERVVVDYLV